MIWQILLVVYVIGVAAWLGLVGLLIGAEQYEADRSDLVMAVFWPFSLIMAAAFMLGTVIRK